MSVVSIYQVDKNQEVRRKRSFWVSLYLHIAILLLALFPFMIETPPFDVDRQQSVVIEFTNDAASSKQAAYKLESGPPADAKQESQKAQPKVTPVETKPVETKVEEPKRPVEDIKIPVMTDPNSSDMPVEPDFEEPEPVEEEPVEVVKTPTKPAEKPSEDPVDAPEESKPDLAELIFGEEESGGSDPNKTEGDAKKSGGGGFDPYSQDESEGSSPWGSGNMGTEVEGEGIFGRKVIKRADVAKMSDKSGTIAIKVCVNRQGLVTEAVYLREGSTITAPSQVRKAEEIATRYRFEADNSAPEKQCGKLTFKFTIKK